MKRETLKVISDELEALGINYQFMEWIGKPKYPYFTGEYQEIEPFNEDGMQENTFILDGFARGEMGFVLLEKAKETISKAFPKTEGKVLKTTKGTVIIYYASGQSIPTESSDLKRMQINLTVKEWSVE